MDIHSCASILDIPNHRFQPLIQLMDIRSCAIFQDDTKYHTQPNLPHALTTFSQYVLLLKQFCEHGLLQIKFLFQKKMQEDLSLSKSSLSLF